MSQSRYVKTIVALGEAGCGRDEIAVRLGLRPVELALREREDPTIADAIVRAESAARAWWAATLRNALASGTHVSGAAWRAALLVTFGAGEAPAAGPEPAPPEARFRLPDNGTRRLPDGSLPEDDPEWRRRHELESLIEWAQYLAATGAAVHEDPEWLRRLAELMTAAPEDVD